MLWFSVLLDLVSVSLLFSPSMCLDDFKLGLCNQVVPFWERAAYSINNMFCFYNVYLHFLPNLISRAGLWF